MNLFDVLRIKKPKHQIDKKQSVTFSMNDPNAVGLFLFFGTGITDAPEKDPTPDGVLRAAGYLHEEDFVRGTRKVTARFETKSGDITGSTDAPVKRVEVNDDGSITVVIDAWPVASST